LQHRRGFLLDLAIGLPVLPDIPHQGGVMLAHGFDLAL
jgi:hypothetical protein